MPTEWVPQLDADLPSPGRRRSQLLAPPRPTASESVVLFPSCVGGLFAPADGSIGASGAFVDLCGRAGVAALIPPQIDQLCCGTIWSSKGLTRGAEAMAARTARALWEISEGGAIPIVCDAASCTHGLSGLGPLLGKGAAEQFARMRIVDAVSFTRTTLLDRLTPTRVRRVAVHPTCSMTQLGASADLIALAGACAEQTLVPPNWGCCAFAGDRGLLHPELTRTATAPEAAAIAAEERANGLFDAYVSANRTCEMGMSRATGHPYRHVLELLASCTASPPEKMPPVRP